MGNVAEYFWREDANGGAIPETTVVCSMSRLTSSRNIKDKQAPRFGRPHHSGSSIMQD